MLLLFITRRLQTLVEGREREEGKWKLEVGGNTSVPVVNVTPSHRTHVFYEDNPGACAIQFCHGEGAVCVCANVDVLSMSFPCQGDRAAYWASDCYTQHFFKY